MNENEAVYCLKADSELHSEVCEECDLYGLVGCNHCQNDAIEIAIKALEEVQQYRAIGTPEECRAAVEKQTAKRPLLGLCGNCQESCVDCDRYVDRCPSCNGSLYVETDKPYEFCPSCGQKLDWSDEE